MYENVLAIFLGADRYDQLRCYYLNATAGVGRIMRHPDGSGILSFEKKLLKDH